MTSKQRSCLKGIAMTTEPILQIGKASLTPELTAAVDGVRSAGIDKNHRIKELYG